MKRSTPVVRAASSRCNVPVDVRVVVKLRLTDRRPHPGSRGEMHDDVEFFAVKKRAHRVAVAQIDLMNLNLVRHRRDIRALDLRIVKVVEIVEN